MDLLQQLLKFDPTERVSAAKALKHSYLKQFHDEFVERDAPCTVKVSIPDEERRSTNHYRERLYKEVAEFRRGEPPTSGARGSTPQQREPRATNGGRRCLRARGQACCMKIRISLQVTVR